MLNVGIVGTGGIGEVHGRHFSRLPDVRLSAYDVDPDRRNAFAQRYDARPAESLDDLLAQADAVVIATPTPSHREQALAAIAAGRAVLLEKPMASTVAEAVEIANAAERAGVPLVPAHVVRFFPEYERAHLAVKAGEVGTPAVARARRGGRAPSGAGGWFRDLARSGGVLLDLALHDFDWLRWTLGEVRAVTARSVAVGRPEGAARGDYALAVLSFEGGALGHVEATWLDPSGFRTSLEICGTKGMLQYDSRRSASLIVHRPGETQYTSPLDAEDDPYARQARAFLDRVRTGAPAAVTARDGILAVSLAQAVLESARTGRSVAPDRQV